MCLIMSLIQVYTFVCIMHLTYTTYWRGYNRSTRKNRNRTSRSNNAHFGNNNGKIRPFKAIRPVRDKASLVASRSYLTYSEETIKEKIR